MYMTQSEIVDRYVRRGTSITILAEFNATRVDQIREILTDAGVELPEAKKTKQQRIECCYDALDDIEQRMCPVCERRIYRANDGEVMKVARGSRQAKVNNHYIQLDSYGRFKD